MELPEYVITGFNKEGTFPDDFFVELMYYSTSEAEAIVRCSELSKKFYYVYLSNVNIYFENGTQKA